MNWFYAYELGNSTRLIRKFLIELASIETDIIYSGMHIARQLEDFDSATTAMDEFAEKFSSIKRSIAHIDKDSFDTLDHLEKNILLTEQISLINLKLQMSRQPRTINHLRSLTTSLAGIFITITRPKKLFDEQSISIERTIVNCDKLISTLKIIEETLRHRETSDDELFKPSRIKESVVIDLLELTVEHIENSHSLPEDTKQLIKMHLTVIKSEAQSKNPKWQNIIGSLMVVAAITSSLADVPEATKTIQNIIQYIVGASVIKPEQLSLPSPSGGRPDGEAVDLFDGIQI